jgi:hypothetical protein
MVVQRVVSVAPGFFNTGSDPGFSSTDCPNQGFLNFDTRGKDSI